MIGRTPQPENGESQLPLQAIGGALSYYNAIGLVLVATLQGCQL